MSQKAKVIDFPGIFNEEAQKCQHLRELVEDFGVPESIGNELIFEVGFNENDLAVLRSFNSAERKLWLDFVKRRNEAIEQYYELLPAPQMSRWAVVFILACIGFSLVGIVFLLGFLFGGRH